MQQIVLTEEYQRLHKIIRDGIDAAADLAQALMQMKDGKHYKAAGYDTFADYCVEEFDISPRQARRLMLTAPVKEQYGIESERAAEKLLQVPEDLREEVVDRAKTRMGGTVTAPMIEDMHDEIVAENERLDDDGTQPQPKLDMFDDLRTLLVSAGKKLNALHESRAGAHIRLTNVRPNLLNALKYIEAKRPEHVCYACHGRGCKVCKDTGWITNEILDNRPEGF
tara:strand:+ start:2227 stop:2898 length:672 start_codon:yes stop_codon:yes gene_type:complete